MKRFCFLVFLNLSIFLFSQPLDLEVSATSAILVNAKNSRVLFEKHAHRPSFPASTTKVATALYILEQGIDLQTTAIVSAECLKGRPLKDRDHMPPYWLDSDGTMMGLKRGEEISFESLLHGLMLISGNDAANVLAETVGGTIPQFMENLNEYLQRIGCKNTQFQNPHGLHHPHHWTTAFDLALIAKRSLEIEGFRKIVSTLQYVKPKSNKQPESEFKLTNPLMKPGSKYYYPKAIGIKTGHTNAAQDTLVAAAEHEGRTLIAVVLGCERSGSRYEDVKRMFEKAFSEEKKKRVLIGSDHRFKRVIEGAKDQLVAMLSKTMSIEFFPSEEPKCKAILHWYILPLPIQKGQKVGEVHIHDEDGIMIQKGDLVAAKELQGTFGFNLKQKFVQLFSQ